MSVDIVFKFFFKKDNQFYYIDQYNNVALSNNEIDVKSGVSGWEDNVFSLVRNLSSWGLVRQYSLDLRFVNDAAKILRHVYYTEGFQGDVTLEVRKLNTLTQGYNLWTNCKFDFTTANDEKDYFSCSLLEGGLMEIFEAKKNNEYEFEIPSKNKVILNGLNLNMEAKWLIGGLVAVNLNPGISSGAAVPFMPYSSPTDYDYFQYVLDKKDQEILDGGNVTLGELKKRLFLRSNMTSNVDMGMTIKGGLDVSFSSSIGVSLTITLVIREYDPINNSSIDFQTGWVETGLAQGVVHNIFINYTLPISFTVHPKRQYVLMLRCDKDGGSQSVVSANFKDVEFKLTTKTSLPVSAARCIRYIDFVKNIFEQMTDGQYNVQSNFLNNPSDSGVNERKANFGNSPYNTYITSGMALKKYSNPFIRTTFDKVLKDLWAEYAITPIIIGDTMYLEPLDYVFQENNNLGTFEQVSNYKISCLDRNSYNRIKIGQEKFEYGQLNGSKEQSVPHEYSINSITKYTNEEDLITPFRKDVYGIEWVRREVFNAVPDSDNTSYINQNDGRLDVFKIELNPNFITSKGGEFGFLPYTGINIINSELQNLGLYNVGLSTKRMLLRHLKRIRSLINYGTLIFHSANNEVSMVSSLGVGQLLIEKGNVLLGQPALVDNTNINLYINNGSIGFNLSIANNQQINGEPYFKHYMIELDIVTDYNLMEQIGNNFNGYYNIILDGRTYKVFILDIGVIPSKRDKYRAKFLFHKDSNLQYLIK